MDHETLALAREDWAHSDMAPHWTLCADDLIALAVGHVRQDRQAIAPLTEEDAAILGKRCAVVIDQEGNYRGFNNSQVVLAYVRSLNI